MGPKQFARFFAVTRTVKPTTRFTTEQFNVFTSEQRQRLAQAGVCQFKPSIKAK